MKKALKIILFPLYWLKFVIYRWLLFTGISGWFSIYIYKIIKNKTSLTSINSLNMPVWACLLLFGATLLILGFSISYSISHGRNIRAN